MKKIIFGLFVLSAALMDGVVFPIPRNVPKFMPAMTYAVHRGLAGQKK